ncbi:hypothetical protein ACIQFZ_30180 [Streptomyces sp. NPDC093064]|uniref:hypothetical protein n=1 Tax=Streptomyces sp. NPDC093064 TaxID=3366020 RepID=UPI003821F5F8
MIMTRSKVVTAAVSAAAALAVTGITYATAAPAPAPQAAPATPAVVQQAPAPAQAPMGGEGGQGGQGGQGKGNEGGGGRGGEGGEGGEGFKGKRHHEIGRIFINERSFSAHPDGCITVVSGLGSKSFNIRNDSKRTVEFFRGATCDNGAPVATVGPHSEANGVKVHHTKGVHVRDGVVGSFRVVKRHHGEDFDF